MLVLLLAPSSPVAAQGSDLDPLSDILSQNPGLAATWTGNNPCIGEWSMALFSAVLVLGAGELHPAASTALGAFYDTFMLLLGDAQVGLPELLPDDVTTPAAARLLAVLPFYGRQLLFVFVLMNFFMAVLGDVFVRIKRTTWATARGVPADLRKVVLPELAAWAEDEWRRRRGGSGGGCGGCGGGRRRGAAVAPAAEEVDTIEAGGRAALAGAAEGGDGSDNRAGRHTSAALLDRLQAARPGLASGPSKAFADSVSCIELGGACGGKLLTLGTLQRLVADLSLQGEAILASLPAVWVQLWPVGCQGKDVVMHGGLFPAVFCVGCF